MKRITILLLAAAVVMMVFTGCAKKATKQNGNQKAITSNPKTETGEKKATTAQPETVPFPEKPTAKDVLERMAVVYKSIKTLKINGTMYQTISSRNEKSNTNAPVTICYVVPNKIMYEVGKGNDKITTMSNGKTMYMYSSKMNVYQKTPAPKTFDELQKGSPSGISTAGLLSNMDISPFFKTAKLKPSQKIGGVDTYVIQYPISGGIIKSTGTETIWVGKSDFLIRQVEIVAKITPGDIPGKPGSGMPQRPITMTQKNVVKSVVANKSIPDSTFKFVPPSGAKDAAKIQMPKPPAPPNVMGKAAPGFSLADLNGKQVSLSDYRGKPVLLVFWLLESPQSKDMMPVYQKLQNAVKGSGAVMIGIYLGGDKDALNKYLKDNGIKFITTFDRDKAFPLTGQYGLMNVPSLFVIGADGKIKANIIGPKTLDQLTSEVAKYGIK